MTDATKIPQTDLICERCGEPITGTEPYASFGGNWVPYVPAKTYHGACRPTLQELVGESKPPITDDRLREVLQKFAYRIAQLTSAGESGQLDIPDFAKYENEATDETIASLRKLIEESR
jgi:hypothetical protein